MGNGGTSSRPGGSQSIEGLGGDSRRKRLRAAVDEAILIVETRLLLRITENKMMLTAEDPGRTRPKCNQSTAIIVQRPGAGPAEKPEAAATSMA
jgi:hypothetical protein